MESEVAWRDEHDNGETARPRWFEWVQKNSRPKVRSFPRPTRQLTPWQKRGPMTRRDWVRFYHWAAKNAIARPPYSPPEEPAPVEDRRMLTEDDDGKQPVTLSDVYEDVEFLAKPRFPRKKFEAPKPENFAYSPRIHWDKAPIKDKTRPVKPPKVPKKFYNYDLQYDFWSEIRFPISRAALERQPSAKMAILAKPKVPPPLEEMHCPVPIIPPEIIPPRKRFTPRQWKAHLLRLEYLAKPVIRPYCIYF